MEIQSFPYQSLFIYGMTIGMMVSVALMMGLFALFKLFWQKQRSHALLFAYNMASVFCYLLFSLYMMDSHFPAINAAIPKYILALGCIAMPLGLYFNTRMLLSFAPSTSMRAFLFWHKTKWIYYLAYGLYLSLFFLLFYIASQHTAITIILAISVANALVGFWFLFKIFRGDLLSHIYAYGLFLLACVLAYWFVIYMTVDASELHRFHLMFVITHLLLSLIVLVCSFLQLSITFQKKKAIKHTPEPVEPVKKKPFDSDDIYRDIYHALKHDEFFLVYQPKVSLETQEVSGVEALIRWKHRKHGLIPPNDFIPVAEQGNSINHICKWVIDKAVTDAKTLYQQGIKVPVSINFSVNNISIKMVDFLKQKITETGLPMEMITVEITESLFLHMSPEQHTALNMIKEAGIHLSLDDFSAGFSSLQHLDEMALDELKIDRELTSRVSDQGKHTVVSTIITMCQSLEIQVVAEGVEDDKMIKALKEFDCQIAQGYGLCRPKKLSDLVLWHNEYSQELNNPQNKTDMKENPEKTDD